MAVLIVIFCLFWVFYAYFGYPALLFALCSFRRRPGVQDLAEEELPGLTMVVPAHNEALVISQKIANFLSLDYPKDRLRLVIGSDGSTDGTASRAAEVSAQAPQVTVLAFDERKGKVNVINRIVPTLRTPLVVLSDANTHYDRGSLRRLVRHFSDGRVGAVCGRLLLVQEGEDACEEETVYWRYETFLKLRESQLGTMTSINGQVLAFRRELFVGLPEDCITEDQYLGLQILLRGFQIRFEPEALVREPVGSLAVEKARRLRISTGNFQTFFKIGYKALNPGLGFAAFAYLSHKVLRWCVPFLLALAFAACWMPGGPIWLRWLGAIQAVFYASSALFGSLPCTRRARVLRLGHYVVSMNLVVLRGFVKFVRGNPVFPWPRTARTAFPADTDVSDIRGIPPV